MSIFGKQSVVSAMSTERNYDDDGKNTFEDHLGKKYWFEVRIYGGKVETGIDAIEWARKVESLGAGEILLTSIDADEKVERL